VTPRPRWLVKSLMFLAKPRWGPIRLVIRFRPVTHQRCTQSVRPSQTEQKPASINYPSYASPLGRPVAAGDEDAPDRSGGVKGAENALPFGLPRLHCFQGLKSSMFSR
jgi:hypothetical protein